MEVNLTIWYQAVTVKLYCSPNRLRTLAIDCQYRWAI